MIDAALIACWVAAAVALHVAGNAALDRYQARRRAR